MPRVLITGAGGFVGSHLVERFGAAGFSVRATDLASADLSPAAAAGAEVVPSDITDAHTLPAVMRDCDVVVHTAAIFHFAVPWPVMARVNIDGTANMVKAARAAGVGRFVQFSTVGVYGRPASIPCHEEMVKRPRNFYERSKWEAEQVAFAADDARGMRVAALRPTLVYGPRSRYGHAMYLGALSLLHAAGRRKLATLAGGPWTHHVHVADVAEAAWLLATHPQAPGRAFNIADDTPLRAEDFLRTLADSVGLGTGIRLPYAPMRVAAWLVKHTPLWLFERLRRRMRARWARLVERYGLVAALDVALDRDWADYALGNHWYDVSRIKGLGLTLSQPSFAAGIRQVVAWYRCMRWLPDPSV